MCFHFTLCIVLHLIDECKYLSQLISKCYRLPSLLDSIPAGGIQRVPQRLSVLRKVWLTVHQLGTTIQGESRGLVND